MCGLVRWLLGLTDGGIAAGGFPLARDRSGRQAGLRRRSSFVSLIEKGSSPGGDSEMT